MNQPWRQVTGRIRKPVPGWDRHENGSALQPLIDAYREKKMTLPEIEFVASSAIPKPYGNLLVHENDMTPTLERFHGSPIQLNVIHKHMDDAALVRQVVLVTASTGDKVEFGAIRINLSQFPDPARHDIMKCRTPLGTILNDHKIPHHGRPAGFIRVRADDCIARSLELDPGKLIYGRCNTIFDDAHMPLAHIVEILPPCDSEVN